MSERQSPLFDWHTANGAQFVELSGWQVPNFYSKPDIEYAALRNGAGFTDLWHHSRYRIEGDDTLGFLNELLTINVSSIAPETCGFGYMCNDRGGIIDSFMIYRDPNYCLLLGTPAGRGAAFNWLQAQAQRLPKYHVRVADVSSAQGQISVRGPGSAVLIERLCFGQKVNKERGEVTLATIGTARCLVIATTFGPVKGFDVITGSLYVTAIWEKLQEAARATGARHIGHAAHDILRIESGIPAVGFDVDEDTTPIEINQITQVDFTKRVFIGRRALMHSTAGETSRSLVSLKFDGMARIQAGAEILFETIPVGRITSAAQSPFYRSAIALGYINSYKAVTGTRLSVRSEDGQLNACEVMRETMRIQG